MEAVDFLVQKGRFCKFYFCYKCPIYKECALHFSTPVIATEAVEKIKAWAEEHPLKETRQSKFLKLYPNTSLEYGVIKIKPCDIEEQFKAKCCQDNCPKCRLQYWTAEIE